MLNMQLTINAENT